MLIIGYTMPEGRTYHITGSGYHIVADDVCRRHYCNALRSLFVNQEMSKYERIAAFANKEFKFHYTAKEIRDLLDRIENEPNRDVLPLRLCDGSHHFHCI